LSESFNDSKKFEIKNDNKILGNRNSYQKLTTNSNSLLNNSSSVYSVNKQSFNSEIEIKTQASTQDTFSLNISSEKGDIISEGCLKINTEKISKGSNKLVAHEMGTTVNVVLIKQNYLYISNLGDSLAVIYKNGIAEKLTTEHKVSLKSEKTRIEKSGTIIINNRIEGRLNLTRAIGTFRYYFKFSQNMLIIKIKKNHYFILDLILKILF